MNRLFYLILAVSSAVSCTKGLPNTAPSTSERQIVIATQVPQSQEGSKAPLLSASSLTGVQFLRKDAASSPTNFSGVSPISGNRDGGTGDITFAIKPTYSLANIPAYFSAYYPSGNLSANVVTWTIGGSTDILLTRTVYDAGKYTAPKTGKGGADGQPMVLNHLLAQLEVTFKADGSAGVDLVTVKQTWGKVLKIELVETAVELKYTLSNHTVVEGAKGAVSLLGSYDTPFPAAGVDLSPVPTPASTAVGMFAPGAGVAPIKLRITTEKGGVKDVLVQLKSGTQDKGFQAGLLHTVSLVFKASDQVIVVESTKIAEWKEGYTASTEVSTPPPYVELNGLLWATGNLVADGNNGCKIGKPYDSGLYFQFGSLIGYKGGSLASGGTGEGTVSDEYYFTCWDKAFSFVFANEVMVRPAVMTSNPGDAWPRGKSVNEWYFGHGADPYDKEGADPRNFAGYTDGTLADKGVGDPCTYYLGAPWRMPTNTELTALRNSGFSGSTLFQINDTEGYYLGAGASSKDLSTSCFLPASGYRYSSLGVYISPNSLGYYCSSTIVSSTEAYYLGDPNGDNAMQPQSRSDRSYAGSVRCVASKQ